jgi:hypothetical protein
MDKSLASCKKARKGIPLTPHLACIAYTCMLLAFPFISASQTAAKTNYKDYKTTVLSISYFVESANNSVNSLNSLLRKDNYRNKITTLNNPTNNELGFSLKNEILNALKPLLDKAKRTDTKKFKDVMDNFLSNPEENGIGQVKKYLPALGIFSTILSLVGSLVINEKNITREDLNQFTSKIQQYFSQYEKLNSINEQFGRQVQSLVERSDEIKQDLKDFLVDCICSMNNTIARSAAKEMSVEMLLQRHYDPQKLQAWLDTAQLKTEGPPYPQDAPTSAKLLTSAIKKLQKEFETLYGENYNQLKTLITSLKTTIPGLDQGQLDKTNTEIDQLYKESRQADVVNLNITQVDERMNTVCRLMNK